jgi:outer membrane protein TolC
MTRRITGITIIFLLGLGLYLQGDENQQSISLSLQDCIARALEHNLGLAVEYMTPQLRDADIAQANEKFLPTLSFNLLFNKQERASYSFLDAAEVLQEDFNQYGVTLNQEIPTGGNLSIDLGSSRFDTNRTGVYINPSYRAELRFDFTQPLLRNFGLNNAKRDILIAQTNYGVSQEELKRALQETVYSVEQAYWELVYAIENLKVEQLSLKLAQDLLEKNKRAVEVGTMAPIEIISAQAQVASREASILAADTNVKNQEDRLKLIINLAAETPEADRMTIIPTEQPDFAKKDINLEEALTAALQNRPDLNAQRIELENYERNVGYAKNQLLPNLNLRASYWSPGVSGDQLLFDPDDPLGPPVGSIPGGREDAFKDVFGFSYNNWSVGFTFDLPLNTFISRAAHVKAQVDLQQALLRIKDQEQQIYTDLKIAVRSVESNFKRINALKIARELAEKQLEAEEEKLKVGLTTNYFVLDYQSQLAARRSEEIRAIVDYILSLALLSRDMGVNLDERNIRISQFLNQ